LHVNCLFTIISNLWNPFPSTSRSTSASIPAQICTLRMNRSNTVIIRERFASRMWAVISVLLGHRIFHHNILLTCTYACHARVTGRHCWSLPYRDICTMHIFYIRCYNLFYKCVMNVNLICAAYYIRLYHSDTSLIFLFSLFKFLEAILPIYFWYFQVLKVSRFKHSDLKL